MHLCQRAGAHRHDYGFPTMHEKQKNRIEAGPQRVRLTVHVSVSAYDVLSEAQRRHRREHGKALPLWRIINAAIIDYAKRERIKIGE